MALFRPMTCDTSHLITSFVETPKSIMTFFIIVAAAILLFGPTSIDSQPGFDVIDPGYPYHISRGISAMRTETASKCTIDGNGMVDALTAAQVADVLLLCGANQPKFSATVWIAKAGEVVVNDGVSEYTGLTGSGGTCVTSLAVANRYFGVVCFRPPASPGQANGTQTTNPNIPTPGNAGGSTPTPSKGCFTRTQTLTHYLYAQVTSLALLHLHAFKN